MFLENFVVKLPNRGGVDLVVAEPALPLLAHRGLGALQQHGRAVQAGRKRTLQLRLERRGAEKAHGAAAQGVVKGFDADAFGHGLVRNHQIQLVQRQLGQQVGELALAANHAHRGFHLQRRLQQPVGERLGDRVGHAHLEVQHPAPAAGLAHRGFQFGAQRKYLVGIAQRQPAVLGQLHLAAAFVEQLAAQPVFQQLDLAGQGLRRGVQLLARAHDAAGLGGDPKVVQVFEVHGGPLANTETKRNTSK